MKNKNKNKIKCEICGQWFKSIIGRHLQKHDTTLTKYKEQFPHAPVESELTQYKKKEHGRTLGESRRGIPRSRDTVKQILETKRKNPKPAWNKGIPRTEQQKRHASEKAKRDFATGKRVPYNKGKPKTEEAKQHLRQIAAEKNRELNDKKKKIKKQKQTRLQSTIFEKLCYLHNNNVEIIIPVPVAPMSIRKLDAVIQHLHFLESEKFELMEVNDKNCSPTLSNYRIKCLTCGNQNIKITNQHLRPCKYKKRRKSLCDTCDPRSYNRSSGEIEIGEFIQKRLPGVDIRFNDRQALEGQEIDIFIPSLKLGIEFTGVFWHGEKVHNVPKNVFLKHKKANKKGIRIITIFEDEWNDKRDICESRLLQLISKTDNRYYARKTKCHVIDTRTANDFLEKNHIQGPSKSASCAIGAYIGEELVSVMTFGKTNIIKGGNGERFELLRFASKINWSVIGVASKLFKFGVDQFDLDTVVSYCDLRWGTGKVYQKMGFKFSHTSPPNYWYVPAGKKQRFHRSKFMKHKLSNILKEFNSDLTEWENMKNNGYDRIWDCGNSVWVWERNLR